MKSMKEIVKEQFGVDTLTGKEKRAEFEKLGFTKEEVRKYYSLNYPKEEVDLIMDSLYSEDKKG